MNIEENGVSGPITKDDLSKVIAAFDSQTSSGSRFSYPAKALREAEAFCEDADAVDQDDRIHEEHMCLALWDELRNLRRENARLRAALYVIGYNTEPPCLDDPADIAQTTLTQSANYSSFRPLPNAQAQR